MNREKKNRFLYLRLRPNKTRAVLAKICGKKILDLVLFQRIGENYVESDVRGFCKSSVYGNSSLFLLFALKGTKRQRSQYLQTIFFATLRWITISRTRSWYSSDPLCSLSARKYESKKAGSLRIRFLHYSALSFRRRVIGLKISRSLFAFFAKLHYIG